MTDINWCVWQLVRVFPISNRSACSQDVFIPATGFPRQPSTSVLFLHGGAWSRGDKNHMFHLHANVGVALARAGFVGLNMNYRLHPEVRGVIVSVASDASHCVMFQASIDDQLDDVGAALAWIAANAPKVKSNADCARLSYLCGCCSSVAALIVWC